MTTVYTKSELEKALKAGEKEILCKGEVAQTIAKRKKRKKGVAIGSAALAIGSLVAIPFTAGASAPGVVAGITGLTVGSVTLTTVELFAILGLVGYGMYKKYDMVVSYDIEGKIEVRLTGKK